MRFLSPARSARAVAAVCALVPAALAAQLPVSTGANAASGPDSRWEVATNGGPFAAAQIVASPSFEWAPNTAAYRWISSLATASTGGATTFAFRLAFDLTGYDPATASLTFRYAVDNDDLGVRLNGGAATLGAGTNYQFGGVQTLTTGFVAGLNTLTFNLTGDGTTDGLVVDVQSFTAAPTSVVPEPGTVALTGVGLALAGVVARRRRQA